MTQKTCIITGASTGIGYALALKLAGQGYTLGLTARRLPLLEDLKKNILSRFPHAQIDIEVCDITNFEQTTMAINILAKKWGRLDLFIANAGIGYQTPAWEKNKKEVIAILNTNLMGTIFSIEVAKEIMLEQKSGHLVPISSVAAFRGLPTSSAYATSKAGLTTYTESLRMDLKKHGIMVTSIHPGYIATPMTEKNAIMPFLLTAEVAAKKISRAIQKQKPCYIFPWPMILAVTIMKLMPRFLFESLVTININGIFKEEKKL